jgi:hypothetical protein
MRMCMLLLYPLCSAASHRGFGTREGAGALCFNCAAQLLLLPLCFAAAAPTFWCMRVTEVLCGS